MRVAVNTKPKPDHRSSNPAEYRPVGEFKTIDWSNSSDRKWLVNHIHWAMNNQQVITLIP